MNKKEIKKLYKTLLPKIREIAYKCGYAIGEHGSMTRDMDLIAIPWIDNCLKEDTLVKRITKYVKGYILVGNTKKPHGRNSYTIVLKNYKSNTDWAIFIDLAVMPQSRCSNNPLPKD